MKSSVVTAPVQEPMPLKRNTYKKPKGRKGKTLFIVCILAIPILNWLVFWLYVNIGSIMLAFQAETANGTVWTLNNFKIFWGAITQEGNSLNISIKNTALYFSSGLLITMPLSLLISYFLSKKIAGYQIYRVIFISPVSSARSS